MISFSVSPSFAKGRIDSISSPDKQLWFYLRTGQQGINYSVTYRNKELLEWSPLGLVFENHILPGEGVTLDVTGTLEKNETLSWPLGENASIQNKYKQLTAAFVTRTGERFDIVIRMFNNDIAFRYVLFSTKDVKERKIIKENTGFYLSTPYTAYRHNTESVITPVPVNELAHSSDLPLVLASPSLYLSINEAANENYTKAQIGKAEENVKGLSIQFIKDTVVVKKGPFYTPWRTISIAENAIGLCSHSDLLYKLSDAPAKAVDMKNIKPGKILRDMTLSTEGAKACIDFAQKNNFQYIMYDAGWYGKGYNDQFELSSNPRHVVPEINMREVTSYGKAKGIGLILYVNYVGLRKYSMDSSFTLYKNWGVKGLKFGFVDGLTQDGIVWLMTAVKKAQDYGFIIDVHDNYKPTGLSRTYPAWLTQEGVRGNENNPDAVHNTTLPFTRFLSGAADYTFCYRNQNDSFNTALLSKKLQVSKGQQMALTVIFFSPLQSMLWYGRPADYRLPLETEFFSYVPTVWDKTIPIEGEIGQYVTIARKKAGVWYIGSAAGNTSYYRKLKLDFLDNGKQYTAFIYSDDGKGGVAKTEKIVNSRSILDAGIAAKGGEAIIISSVSSKLQYNNSPHK